MQPTDGMSKTANVISSDLTGTKTTLQVREVKKSDAKACFIILVTLIVIGILLSQGHIWGSVAVGRLY